jgi:predicted RNase H-like nuclease
MRAVLGIDAAWTKRQPSGVAMLVEERDRWRCAGLAPSYADFIRLAEGEPVDWGRQRVEGGELDAAALVRASRRLAPEAELLSVGVDMPLARGPITRRRACDDEISRRFGKAKCGTHSPTPERPGPLAERVRQAFEGHGFALAVGQAAPQPAVLEVYPHVALLALTGSEVRLEYKVARSRKFWPGLDAPARRQQLLAAWRGILRALRREVAFELDLPARPQTFSGMKRFEDALDALVCAWMAREFLLGRAKAEGDEFGAIWVPATREVLPNEGK